MEQTHGPNKVLIGIIIVVLLAAVGGGVLYLTGQNQTSSQVESNTNSQASSSSDQVDTSSTFKDGTYTATGTYQSPGGSEEIKITVTVQDNKIADTTATAKAASGTSKQYQQEFVGGYKELVVGKNINDIELDRVAGSSLTSNGFNDALEQIRQEAAA